MSRPFRLICILAAIATATSAVPASADSRAHISYKGYDLRADEISGSMEDRVEASGDVSLASKDGIITADSITHNFKAGEIEADGHVRVTRSDPQHGDVEVTAEQVEGDTNDGSLRASRGVRLKTSRGSLMCGSLSCNTNTRDFAASDGVRADYTYQETGEVILVADSADGNIASGQVTASGNVTLQREEVALACDTLKYDFESGQFRALDRVHAKYDSGTGKATLIAQRVEGSQVTGELTASGGVRGTFPLPDGGDAVLTAEQIARDAGSEDLKATGSPTLESPQGTLTCTSLTYNPETKQFTADGGARGEHTGAKGEKVELTAGIITGDMAEKEIKATGNVSLVAKDRSLSCGDLTYSMDSGKYTAENDVLVSYDQSAEATVLLTAQKVDGSLDSGDIEASGDVVLKQKQGRTFTGETFTYNLETDEGMIRDASAVIDKIHFRGEEIKSEAGQYTITGSRFTTCDKDENPHYYLSARELTVVPNKEVVARHVSLNLFGATLFTIPKYKADLGDSGVSTTNLPSLGLNDKYGAYAAYEFDISDSPRNIGGLAVRLSTGQAFQGGVLYDRFAGRPAFLRFTYREPFYSGGRPDILLSRLPEIGFRFCSGEAAEPYALSRAYSDLAGGTINTFGIRQNGNKLNLVTEVGAGRFREEPSRVTSSRVDARVIGWLDPIYIGAHTVFSPGISARLSHYQGGEDYTSFALRLSVARQIGTDAYASLSYITNSVHGSTPFEFDKVELREEIAGRIGFPLGGFRLEFGGRYDVRNPGLYDTDILLAQKVHCLEPSIRWRSRFKELSFGLTLVEF